MIPKNAYIGKLQSQIALDYLHGRISVSTFMDISVSLTTCKEELK